MQVISYPDTSLGTLCPNQIHSSDEALYDNNIINTKTGKLRRVFLRPHNTNIRVWAKKLGDVEFLEYRRWKYVAMLHAYNKSEGLEIIKEIHKAGKIRGYDHSTEPKELILLKPCKGCMEIERINLSSYRRYGYKDISNLKKNHRVNQRLVDLFLKKERKVLRLERLISTYMTLISNAILHEVYNYPTKYQAYHKILNGRNYLVTPGGSKVGGFIVIPHESVGLLY